MNPLLQTTKAFKKERGYKPVCAHCHGPSIIVIYGEECHECGNRVALCRSHAKELLHALAEELL